MEFIETPTFWCPHLDRAACTNFSSRTVELRPPESWEILHFPFSHFLSFSFSPFLSFFLFFIYEFFLFLYFLFAFLSFPFLISFSHHFFFSFLFLFLFVFFFSYFLDHHGAFGQGKKLPPPFSCHLCGPNFFFLISLFLFMTSYPTWLNMSHGIMPPM